MREANEISLKAANAMTLHRGSQVPTWRAKKKLLNLKKPFKYGLCSLKLDRKKIPQKILRLVLRVGSRFLLDRLWTLNTSPRPHLQKVVPCRHPCHTCSGPMWHGKSQLPCSPMAEMSQLACDWKHYLKISRWTPSLYYYIQR